MRFSYIIAIFALSLSACSNDKSDKNTDVRVGQKQVPDQIQFSPSQPSAELTAEQIADIKNTFSKKSTMELPPSELLLKDPDHKMTDSELAEQRSHERMLEYSASANTLEMYRSMRANCHKQRLDSVTDMSVPMERITQLTDLKTGDKMTTNVSAGYSGSACDVDLGGGINYGLNIDRIDKDALISAGANYSLKALLKNTKYAQFLKSRGIVMTAGVSAIAAKQNVNTMTVADTKGMVTFDLNGSYYTESKEIPYKNKYMIHAKALGESSVQLQVIYKMDINMQGYVAQIDAEVIVLSFKYSSESQMISEKYYVNGISKTRQQLQDMFGSALKMQTAQSTVQVLM